MTRPSQCRRPAARFFALVVACLLASVTAQPSLALSELRRIPSEEPKAVTDKAKDDNITDEGAAPSASDPTDNRIPLPDPLINKQVEQRAEEPVEVLSDISKIPAPVRRMREMIVEAAASGDIERLRALLGKGETATETGDGDEEDPVAALKALSGDPDGLEILAILLDVLSTGFVHVEKGTPDEIYLWPYFAAKPLDTLTPPEKVDLMRLVTAGDVAAMQEFGSYNFYRVGITPDGQWKFFTGGD